MFIWILYMFRGTLYSSSGGQLYQHIWYNHSEIVFRVVIPEVVFIQLSSWGWAHSSSKHVEDSNKHIIEEIVRRVVYLPELSEDARSEKYKKKKLLELSVSGAEFEPETFRIRRRADHLTEAFGHTSKNVSSRPQALAKKRNCEHCKRNRWERVCVRWVRGSQVYAQ